MFQANVLVSLSRFSTMQVSLVVHTRRDVIQCQVEMMARAGIKP